MIPEFLQRRRVGFTYPLRALEEHGIDRPAFAFLVSGVALQPDEGARIEDVLNPYPTVFDGWLAAAATAREAGLVDEVGGRWRATPKGRALASRVRAEADAYLATLRPIPDDDLARLAGLLGEARSALETSDLPHDHMTRTPRFVAGSDPRVPMVALESALFGLWMARDDAHMSAWRDAGFTGPVLDVLTRLWRREAATEAELAAKVSQQRPDDIRAAVARLRRDGLVADDDLALAPKGEAARQQIEDETDARFFAPWPDHVGREAAWIRDQLGRVNTALLPVV